MNNYFLCPVSDKMINERVARMNAAFTLLLLIIYALTNSTIPLVFLVIDFMLRSTALSVYSPISYSSKGLVRYLSFNENLINAGPKIFAARLGLILGSMIVLSIILNISYITYSLAGILGLFSFLEAAFGFCVACRIYPLIYKWLYRS